jgi:hypothetical protein
MYEQAKQPVQPLSTALYSLQFQLINLISRLFNRA